MSSKYYRAALSSTCMLTAATPPAHYAVTLHAAHPHTCNHAAAACVPPGFQAQHGPGTVIAALRVRIAETGSAHSPAYDYRTQHLQSKHAVKVCASPLMVSTARSCAAACMRRQYPWRRCKRQGSLGQRSLCLLLCSGCQGGHGHMRRGPSESTRINHQGAGGHQWAPAQGIKEAVHLSPVALCMVPQATRNCSKSSPQQANCQSQNLTMLRDCHPRMGRPCRARA